MFVIFYGGEKVDLVRFVVKTEIDQERGRLFCMLWIINLISGIKHPEIRAQCTFFSDLKIEAHEIVFAIKAFCLSFSEKVYIWTGR